MKTVSKNGKKNQSNQEVLLQNAANVIRKKPGNPAKSESEN